MYYYQRNIYSIVPALPRDTTLDSVITRQVECPISTHKSEKGEWEESSGDAVDGSNIFQREIATQKILAHVSAEATQLGPSDFALATPDLHGGPTVATERSHVVVALLMGSGVGRGTVWKSEMFFRVHTVVMNVVISIYFNVTHVRRVLAQRYTPLFSEKQTTASLYLIKVKKQSLFTLVNF